MIHMLYKNKNADFSSGSVLVVVLWLLVLTSYLAGDYMMHNRVKAGTAIYVKETFQRRLAIESLIEFFSVQDWIIPDFTYEKGTWMDLDFGGTTIKVMISNEKDRININSASDSQLLDRVIKIVGEDRSDEATKIVDAILDWRDPDSLVRNQGAENDDYYSTLPSPYSPANGFFKTITELMLVRDIDFDLFWGNISQFVFDDGSTQNEAEDVDEKFSFIDSFTIFSNETTRIAVVMPMAPQTYILTILFFEKRATNRLIFIENYTTTFRVPDGEKNIDF